MQSIDAIEFCKKKKTCKKQIGLNSDNCVIYLTVSKQMVFADRGEIISGGNFHGEYPAKVS